MGRLEEGSVRRSTATSGRDLSKRQSLLGKPFAPRVQQDMLLACLCPVPLLPGSFPITWSLCCHPLLPLLPPSFRTAFGTPKGCPLCSSSAPGQDSGTYPSREEREGRVHPAPCSWCHPPDDGCPPAPGRHSRGTARWPDSPWGPWGVLGPAQPCLLKAGAFLLRSSAPGWEQGLRRGGAGRGSVGLGLLLRP